MTATMTKTTTAALRPASVTASPATMTTASFGTSWPPLLPLTAISANSSRAPEAARNSRIPRTQRHLSLPSSLPLPLLSPESSESLGSTGASAPSPEPSLRGSRRRSATLLNPPLASETPSSLPSDRTGNSRRELDRTASASISVHRLRSNSGLALHTNSAALRRYIDYNQDGSTRLPTTGEAHDEVLLQSNGEGSTPPGAPDGPSLFSHETVLAVLRDPEARHRLWDFARSQNSEENLDFLEKVSV